nr:uncharacterized protein LOC111413455 [Onthophagus taurus]
MYSENIVPTIASLKNRLQELHIEIPYSEEHFRRYLQTIGFKYKSLDGRAHITETPRLKKWRWEFIEQIRKHREEKWNIVYLDETWYDTHDVIKKGLSNGSDKCALKIPCSRGKRIIILAGGENGWVQKGLLLSAKNIKDCSADYHQDMDSALFETWFKNQLLPNLLNQRSVIVLDNTSYHFRMLHPKPAKRHKREYILSYMQEHNIVMPDGKITKDKLLAKVNEVDIPTEYVIDGMAKEAGHIVLRLPPYHCILNPIELICSNLKRNIRKHNAATTEELHIGNESSDESSFENYDSCDSDDE